MERLPSILYKKENIMKSVRKGEVYYCDLGKPIGSRQGGTRPVLILQNDIANKYSPTTIIAAITTKRKQNYQTHVGLENCGLPLSSTVMLEQILTIDKAELRNYIGKVDDQTMKEIDRAASISLGIEHTED